MKRTRSEATSYFIANIGLLIWFGYVISTIPGTSLAHEYLGATVLGCLTRTPRSQ